MPDSYQEGRRILISLFEAIPVVGDREVRQDILREMREHYRCDLNVSVGGIIRVDCVHIIDAAMSRHKGLHLLAKAISLFDQSDLSLTFAEHVSEKYPNLALSPIERQKMVRELSLCTQPEQLFRHYRRLTGDVSSRSFEDLEDLVEECEQRIRQELPHPLIRLAEAIADSAANQEHAEIARTWAHLIAKRLDEPTGGHSQQTALEELRSANDDSPAIASARPTLILQLDPEVLRPEYYRLTAHLFLGTAYADKVYQSEDGDPLSLSRVQEELPGVLGTALRMAGQANGEASVMDLEFILPRTLLWQEPVELWKADQPAYMSLAVHFVVVVRDLERHSDPIRRMPMLRKWAMMQEKCDAGSTQLDHWVTCPEASCEPGSIFHELLADDCATLGLTFQPGDGAHAFDLSEALDAGMPIAVWPRGCEHSQTRSPEWGHPDFQAELSQRLAGRTIRDLPGIVYEWRKENSQNPGRGLTLLWDDPTRRAEPDGFRMGTPKSGRPR